MRTAINYNPLPYSKLSYSHFGTPDINWENGKKAKPAVPPAPEPAKESKPLETKQAVKKRVGYWKGKQIPPEARAKMSATQKGIRKSDETRRKMSAAKKGDKNYLFGKTQTLEIKQKTSEALKRAWQKRKENNQVKASAETRRKMSEAKKGGKNFMFGKTHSPEMRQKLSIAAKRMWQERKQKDAAK
jgi:predicted transcriptional regulator